MLTLPAAIFVVEDEALIRMMLIDMIEELGHRVIAEAGNVRDAQALARTAIFDLAILDVNIAGRDPREAGSAICFCHRLWTRRSAERI